MKWSIENLKQLKRWLELANEGEEIIVPDFLALIAITNYQKILEEEQGALHNGHFTEWSLEKVLEKCFKS